MSKLTHVKWISSNLPVVIVNRNDARLYLTKLELKELRDEIDEFIAYYKEDFEELNINWDDFEEFESYNFGDEDEQKD
jgi:hypothetical protein